MLSTVCVVLLIAWAIASKITLFDSSFGRSRRQNFVHYMIQPHVAFRLSERTWCCFVPEIRLGEPMWQFSVPLLIKWRQCSRLSQRLIVVVCDTSTIQGFDPLPEIHPGRTEFISQICMERQRCVTKPEEMCSNGRRACQIAVICLQVVHDIEIVSGQMWMRRMPTGKQCRIVEVALRL